MQTEQTALRDALEAEVASLTAANAERDSEIARLRERVREALEAADRFFDGWCPNARCCASAGKEAHGKVRDALAEVAADTTKEGGGAVAPNARAASGEAGSGERARPSPPASPSPSSPSDLMGVKHGMGESVSEEAGTPPVAFTDGQTNPVAPARSREPGARVAPDTPASSTLNTEGAAGDSPSCCEGGPTLEGAGTAPSTSSDPNVEAVIGLLRERAGQGLRSYGVDTTRPDYSHVDWLRELQAELMDAAIYVEAALPAITRGEDGRDDE